MHLSLDSLNHILTVISVTAFIYSRKDFSKDVIESNLMPNTAGNNVKRISEELERVVDAELVKNKESVLGVESGIYDLDDPKFDEFTKLKVEVKKISTIFTNNSYNSLKQKQDNAINKINNRFKNTSFFIALVSFFLLLLASAFQHEDFESLRVFLACYNTVNFILLCLIGIQIDKINNGRILFYFGISILISSIPSIIPNLSHTIYEKLNGIQFLHLIKGALHCETGYCFLVFISLFIILLPWITCFIRFLIIYLFTTRRMRKEEAPALEKLQRFKTFLETKLEFNKNF